MTARKDGDLWLIRVSDPDCEIAESDERHSYYFRKHMLRVGQLIHFRRLSLGISRIDLSRQTNVKPEDIEAIETLGYNCPVWDLMALLDTLGIDDAELSAVRET